MPFRLLTRNEVANRIGVTGATLRRWEVSGRSPVTPRKFVRSGRVIYHEDDVEKLTAWARRRNRPQHGR
jgi:predicted site-specific integrase-resolvase